MYSRLSGEVLPRLITPNVKILTAVSGGPDSIALAHIIWRYIVDHKMHNLGMMITHVNHKVREEAEEEAELVKRFAGELGVPFIYHVFDAKEYAKVQQKSFQESSREWRYACWKEDMIQYQCSLLATAHHLGDQAETVLYRLLRGSGTAGLAGIYPLKDNIIRPLLSISKKEILDYCYTEKLSYALDKSNFRPDYDRNKIRLELIPLLEREYNEKVQEVLGRTAEILRWDEEFISTQAELYWSRFCKYIDDSKIELSLEAWSQPEAILSRILRKAAALITGEPRGLEYKFIKMIINQGRKSGWKQDLPGLKVKNERNGFFFFRGELEYETNPIHQSLSCIEYDIELASDQWHTIPELGLKVGVFHKPIVHDSVVWRTEIDIKQLEKLDTPLTCRMRNPKDQMFFKRIGNKSIKKVFQEYHIPPKERERIPFFAAGNQIIWIPGICRSDSLLPHDEKSPVLYAAVVRIDS